MNRFNKLINSINFNNIKPSLLEKLNNNKIVVYNRQMDMVLLNKSNNIKSFRKIIKINLLVNKLI